MAPQFAGLIALVSQKTNSRQGQANYTIYDLAAHEFGTPANPNLSQLAACSGSGQGANIDNSCIFHDISEDLPSLQGGHGSAASNQLCKGNPTGCSTAKASNARQTSALSAKTGEKLANGAAPGYDNATGLGSVNISNLVERWNAPTAPFASKTALKSSAQKIVPTSSVTLTATVASTGRGGMAVPAGKAQFYLDSTSGTFLGSASIVSNCAGSGSNASCSGVATLTVPGKALNPGSNSVIAYFEGDGARRRLLHIRYGTCRTGDIADHLIHSANRCGLRCISHHLERYCHFGSPGHFFLDLRSRHACWQHSELHGRGLGSG